MQTTAQLVKTAKDGSSDAFGELVVRYERLAITTALTIVGDYHHAQDIAQESFVAAFRELSHLRNDASFGPWLLVAIRRRANRFRGRVREKPFGSMLEQIIPEQMNWHSDLEAILPVLSQLPDQELEVVNLRYLNGLSVQEVANTTKRPVGTVTKQLSRAIHRLRDLVAEIKQ